MKLIIDIPEEIKYKVYNYGLSLCPSDKDQLIHAIVNGTPLPKGHGRLKDENYLLSILRCEEYETCTWRSCSDCNREKCIKYRDIVNAPTIIEADKESEA